MFKKTTFAAALLAATVMSGVASAKTFVYCSEASPEGFDPGLYTAGTTFDAAAHTVYNRLLEFKKGSTEVEPGLAESYEPNDDLTEWTFTLRSGVKFHDGSDLDANDVARTYRAQWDAEDPAHTGRVGDFTYFSALFGGFLNPPPAES